ncbi:hypothetical protein V6Z11_D05G275200 [Gossypium hirsutum]
MATPFVFSVLILQLLFASQQCHRFLTAAADGRWQLLQKSIGVSAMHMQLLRNDRVVVFDRTDFGPSKLPLPNGKCRNDPSDTALKVDCTAHSVEYDVLTNTFRPLMVQTDVWCSSGAIMSNGNLVQTGGFNDGERRFVPKTITANTFSLPFLSQTSERGVENNLYPFVFLNVDGNLFIFANNRAILLDYMKNKVVKTYPTIPGGDPRSYPSTGSAILLPLKNLEAAPFKLKYWFFIGALNTCVRIKITDPNPQWVMETMPLARVMGDMILLPNGNVLLINGAGSGTAGWELGRNPVLNPYKPDNKIGTRFETQNPTTVPRLYHSTAALLRDGRVLVGGSNPHAFYNLTGVLFPTELSLEAFSPAYLDTKFNNIRPTITAPKSMSGIKYGTKLTVRVVITRKVAKNQVSVTMVAPAFNTHSFSMNQRLLVLGNDKVAALGKATYDIDVTTPCSGNLAPSGFYLLFVVHQGIPSKGIWVKLQ